MHEKPCLIPILYYKFLCSVYKQRLLCFLVFVFKYQNFFPAIEKSITTKKKKKKKKKTEGISLKFMSHLRAKKWKQAPEEWVVIPV